MSRLLVRSSFTQTEEPTWTTRTSTNEPHCLSYLTNHTLFSANSSADSLLWSTGVVLHLVRWAKRPDCFGSFSHACNAYAQRHMKCFFFLIPLCIMHSHMCTGCMHNMHIFANVSGTARTCLLEGRMVLNPLIIFFQNMLLNEQWTYSDQIFFHKLVWKGFCKENTLKLLWLHIFSAA